jgi:hypothetical protein
VWQFELLAIIQDGRSALDICSQHDTVALNVLALQLNTLAEAWVLVPSDMKPMAAIVTNALAETVRVVMSWFILILLGLVIMFDRWRQYGEMSLS